MTQDEIIEMWNSITKYAPSEVRITEFAKLAAAKEREACAKVCENMAVEWKDQPEFAQVEIATMMDCALAIRNRGEA